MDETDVATVVAGNRTHNIDQRTKIFSEGKVEIGKDGKKRLVFEISEVAVQQEESQKQHHAKQSNKSNTC